MILFSLAILAHIKYKGNRIELETTSNTIFYGKRPLSREISANIWSRWTFSWFNPIIQLGYKKSLTSDDMWELLYDDQSEYVTKKFDEHCTS